MLKTEVPKLDEVLRLFPVEQQGRNWGSVGKPWRPAKVRLCTEARLPNTAADAQDQKITFGGIRLASQMIAMLKGTPTPSPPSTSTIF